MRNVTRREALGLMGGLTAAAGLSGCGLGTGSAGSRSGSDADPMRLLLDWFPNPDHVGIYTAQERGQFASEGTEVELTPPSNPTDPLKLVASGEVPLGISYQPDTIIARSQGLDVIAVAAVIPTALNSVIAPESSPVDSPADLAGRTVGTSGLPSEDLYLQQIFSNYGIDEKSVRTVNVSDNLVAAMLSGKVDATLGAYRNIEGVQLEHRGASPLIVPVSEAGVPDYDELVLVASASRLSREEGYRTSVGNVIRALGAGTDAAVADPAAATTVMRDRTEGYRPEVVAEMVRATLPLLKNPKGFGWMDIDGWQEFADWMHRRGGIESRVDAASAASNDYLPA